MKNNFCICTVFSAHSLAHKYIYIYIHFTIISIDHKINGDEKTGSPSKSDTLKSTDSASGGETLEDRSSKEVLVHTANWSSFGASFQSLYLRKYLDQPFLLKPKLEALYF